MADHEQRVPPAPFRPSVHGFPFANAETVGLPFRLGGVRVAAVRGGLCGGMCVAARDRWERADPVPREPRSPAPYLAAVQRAQVRSFRLPWAPLRYLRLQQPGAEARRRASTLGDAVPALRRVADAGRPLLLALVCALGRSPQLLDRHHVVLAYDVTWGTDRLVASVYDPNHPDDDGVRVSVSADGTVRHSHRRDVVAAFALDR